MRSNLPWLVGGDINEIFFNLEKKKGTNKLQVILDNFRDTFSACNLHDLGFTGYEFTWWNKRDDDQLMEEHLNHFCANIEWSLLFLELLVYHIDVRLYDHFPIQLKLLGDKQGINRTYRKGFKFENMWALQEECGDIIRRA